MKLRSTGLFVLGMLFPILLGFALNFFPRANPDVTVTNQNQARFAVLPRFTSPGNFNNGLAPVRDGTRWGFINPSGDWVIEPTFSAARPFHQGLAAVRTESGWGYIDRSGNWVIAPQFESAKSFHDNRAAVKNGNQWAFINRNGKLLTSFRFEWVDRFRNGRAVVSTGETMGYLEPDGNFAITPQYRDAHGFSEGLAAVRTDRGWGLIDRDGRMVVNPQFKWANSPRGELSRVRTDTGWSLLETGSGQTHSIGASFVSRPGPKGLVRFKKNGLIGFYDRNLNRKIKPQYDQALSFTGEYTPAKTDGLWGYIDRSGEWVIPPKFNAAGRFRDNLAPVKVGDEWGYIPKPTTIPENTRITSSTFWVDTGLESVEPEQLNDPLSDRFPTWRYDNRDRYVKVLGTDRNHWERERLVPSSNFGMPNAKYEVTRFPYREPTYLQIEAAEQFFWRTLKTATLKDWFRPENGLRDGFNFGGKGGVDNHFFKEEHFLDGSVLVPVVPESLIYHEAGSRKPNLTGVMYYHNNPTSGGPQIGGPLTVWHYHVFDEPVCHEGVLVQPFDSDCSDGEKLSRSPEMIHTWFIDHPEGTFGTQTKLAADHLSTASFSYDVN